MNMQGSGTEFRKGQDTQKSLQAEVRASLYSIPGSGSKQAGTPTLHPVFPFSLCLRAPWSEAMRTWAKFMTETRRLQTDTAAHSDFIQRSGGESAQSARALQARVGAQLNGISEVSTVLTLAKNLSRRRGPWGEIIGEVAGAASAGCGSEAAERDVSGRGWVGAPAAFSAPR